MKKLLFLFLLGINFFSIAQNTRYLQRVFTQTSKSSNVIYGNAPGIPSVYLTESVTTNTDLKMDIFQPVGDNPNTLRPLILLIHPGGFITGSKNSDDMQWLCDSFACRGYVTCSIDYRLNFNPLSSTSAERAVYRGLQDAATAIRYMKEFRNTYKIDTNFIFAWGSSAGAFTALNLAFLDDNERPTSTTNSPNLGCINCTGNTYQHSSKVNAIVSCWGAIGNTNWITSSNNVPTLLFHGDADNVVPYNVGYPFGLPTLPSTSGSLPVSQRLASQNIYYEFYTGVGKGHEYWGTSNGTFSAAPTPDYQDIINKTAIFLYNRLPSTPMAISTSNVTNVSCNGGNNGSATVNATGGGYVCNMRYKWSNGQTTATATNLSAGIYYCTATCGTTSIATQVTITAPAAMTFSQATTQAVPCVGNGSATVLATGTGNISYLWSNGMTGATISISAPGTYTVTATDANSCKKSTSLIVGSNGSLPTAQIQASNDINCINSTATLSNSISAANYSYQWNSPNGTQSTTNSLIATQSGTYFLTVTNTSNNCSSTNFFNLIENKTPPTVNIVSNGILTCTQASRVLKNSQNLATYNYVWTGPSSFASTLSDVNVTNAGTYFLTVTNSINGCKSNASFVLNENKTQPTVNLVSSNILNCLQNSATISNLPLNQNYSYKWQLPNGTFNASNELLATNAGLYKVTVTDITNGCEKTANITLDENKTPPTINITSPNPTINCINNILGTSLDASNSTGLGTLSFLWSGGNILAGKNTAIATVNQGATYTLTVTNSTNGCTAFMPFTVAADTVKPIVTILGDSLLCVGTTKTLQTSGSNNNAFLWSNGKITDQIIVNAAGNYSVTATATNGCSSSAFHQINNAPQPILTISSDSLYCSKDSVQLNVNTTSNLVATVWNGANNFVSSVLSPFVKKAGTYNLLATNDFGCIQTFSKTVFEKKNNIDIELFAKVNCDNQATVNSKVNGAKLPLSYSWSNNNGNTPSINLTAPSSVFLTITDADGCVVSSSPALKIDEYVEIQMTAKIVDAKKAKNDGEIQLNVSSPNLPLTFLWSNNETTKDLKNIPVGKYCVTITDANACTKMECFEVKTNTTSNHDIDFSKDIIIYPNPTEDVIFINKLSFDWISFELFDEKGVLLKTFSAEKNQISLASFPNAIYFLRLKSEKEIITLKVLKI